MIYQPKEDSYLLESIVKKYAKGKKVLDIGSGTGIQVIAAKNAGANSVLASDINSESIKQLKNKNILAIKSDLFSKIKGKFNLIIFNPPYLPLDKKEDKKFSITTTGGKKGDEIIIKFLKQAKLHLNHNGIILIVLSSITPKNRILKILKARSMKKQVLARKSFFMESLEVWKIKIQ